MEGRQKQIIESFQRIQTFLGNYPAPAPATYAEPKAALDEVVGLLTDHSSEQVTGARLSQAEKKVLDSQIRKLRNHHLRPIVAIARANAAQMPGIKEALRMPASGLGFVKLLAEAEAIRKNAALYQPAFVKYGRPADFLEQLAATMEDIKRATVGRATNVGKKVGALAGIAQEVRRGRRAVEMLDSIVQVAFEGNDVVLAAWRGAKRVRAVPGGSPAKTAEAPAKVA